MDDITLNRMTQDQLVQELEHYRYQKLLLHAIDRIARVGYYEWCPDTDKLLNCSEEYANIFKMTSEQMLEAESSLEKSLLQIHPEDREEYRRASDALIATHSMEHEYRIVQKDGAIHHVRETCVVEADPKTGRDKMFGILQDITGLREQRESLEYREALAQQAESITDIGHFIYNENQGTYRYVSSGFARIFGVTADEYQAKMLTPSDDFTDVHQDDIPNLQKVYDKFDEDGKAYSVEYRIHRADGDVRWVRERCITHLMENGEIIESLGVLQDITLHKQSENKLLESQSMLEAMVEERTRELAATIEKLERTRDTLESTVQERTQELAETVSQLKEQISEKERIEVELKFLANHDALTGLPSLRLCMDRLEVSLAEARRNNLTLFVMFIDLDGFKRVNDSYGHDHGDTVLKTTAKRIKAEVRETDTAARIGGDEFLVILPGLSELAIVEKIAGNLITHISDEILIEQNCLKIGASIGIAKYPDDGLTAEALIRQADAAMYSIKQKGKNNYGFISHPTSRSWPSTDAHDVDEG